MRSRSELPFFPPALPLFFPDFSAFAGCSASRVVLCAMVVHLYFAIDQKGLPEGPKALFFISKRLNERLQSVGHLVRIGARPKAQFYALVNVILARRLQPGTNYRRKCSKNCRI
jgi:hypothetical protein